MYEYEEDEWPFSCCEHCGCDDERSGHDDSCIYGCNDEDDLRGWK